MERLYRIVDANTNRASEGLRVLEDLTRFYYEESELSENLKKLRHGIRKNMMSCMHKCLDKRNSSNDVGFEISRKLKSDNKTSIEELITANFKRVQEAVRSIEEYLKVIGEYELSKVYEGYRFETYTLEKKCYELNCSLRKRLKLGTGLYCLTAEEYSRGRSNLEVVKTMIDSGVKIIQYREKDKKLLEKYNECVIIRRMTKEAGVTFIVNDDIDIAMMVEADGVHIGQDDLPVEAVRMLVGDEMIIGVSTHTPEQAEDAVTYGADYIGVGPIYRTSTKKDVCDPVGLEYLDYVVKNVKIPFVAIGGIKEHNIHEVAAKGAKCIAMVSEIVGAEDISQKIADISSIIKNQELTTNN